MGALGWLMGRGASPAYDGPARPSGPLVWLHATTPERLIALIDMAARLDALDMPPHVLLSTSMSARAPARVQPALASYTGLTADLDDPRDMNAFLAHWHPDLCVWAGFPVWPGLEGPRAILIDATEADWLAQGRVVHQRKHRASMTQFERVLAATPEDEKSLRHRLPAHVSVELSEPMRFGTVAPDCNLDDFETMTSHLSGRPVWLAARVHAGEIQMVLLAHEKAVRMSHRLLLVIVPEPGNEAVLRKSIAARNLNACDWIAGEFPDENTQILIAEDPDELGLWFRTAPVSFLGGSMVAGAVGQDPFCAAALGSAVIYGPNVRNHLDAYSRLAAAGAARIVKDGDGLGTAVSQLIAPDQSASMALAAWEAVTEGAALMDETLRWITDNLPEDADADA